MRRCFYSGPQPSPRRAPCSHGGMTKLILALSLMTLSACNSALSQEPAPTATTLPDEQTPAQVTPIQQEPKPECAQKYAGPFLLHECGACTVASSGAGIAISCK